MVTQVFTVIRNTLSQLYNFSLPAVGITFGGLIVFIFGAPLLVKAFKKLVS